MKILLKILMWIAIIAVVIFLVLFLTVKISGNFDNIGQLVDYLINQYKGSGSSSSSSQVAAMLPGISIW